jgi:tRNA-splicing ligase RtcB (3'-phosphate/5'-hydroxy nucleic acid ligase)
MKKVINSEKVPIKLWLNDIEPGALQQAKDIANMPFAFSHVAIMPDCHEGFGMPIGGVLATNNVIIPNAVGVDIGCGMCALQTNLTQIDREHLKSIVCDIRSLVPAGFKHHNQPVDLSKMPELKYSMPIIEREYKNATYQLGTLGGGNHFIEIQKGSDGFVWIMIHSGSRNLGKQVADHYYREALKLNEKKYNNLKNARQLSFLPLDTREGMNYLNEMNYCVDFAFANRKMMMNLVQLVFEEHFKNLEFKHFINIAHNYANREFHFGKEVIVHRKGATSAREGESGIIPGSQGTKSYLVIGKGNPESFMSCSHGAGRVLGRRQAQRTLDFNEEVKKLKDKGILHSIKKPRDLDEAAGAYKDIETVIQNQSDLVEIALELEPLAVIKG